MGFTFQQWKDACESLGHPEWISEHPAASGKSVNERIRELAGMEPPPPSQRYQAPGDAMTKLERSFADLLDLAKSRSLIGPWYREPLKLRLAGRCWYTPDFLVIRGGLILVEVKGPFAREDSIIKLKMAASQYPCFTWLFVRRSGRHDWDVRRVGPHGIGTSPLELPWIIGGEGCNVLAAAE